MSIERKEVEIYPSMWFVVVAICFIMWFGCLLHTMGKTNDKLDILIKLQQQSIMYKDTNSLK